MTTSLSIEIPPLDEESGHSDQVMTQQQQQQQQIETNDEITNSGHTILSLQEHDNDSEHDEGDTSSISSIKQDLVVPSTTINNTSSSNEEGEQNDDKVENNSFNNNNNINHPQDIVTQDGSASVSSFFDRVKAILSPATTFVSSSASTEDNQSKKQSDIGSMCGDPNNVDNNNNDDDDNFIDESNYNDDTQERPGVDEVTFYVSEPPTPIMANKGKNKPTSFSEDSALSDLLEKEKKLLQQKEAKSKAEEVNENYDMFEDESLLTEPTLPSSTGSPSFNSSSDNSISQEDNACATAIVFPPKSPPKSPMRKTPSPKKKRKTLDKPFAFGEMSNSALGGQLKKHVSGFPYGRRWTLITVAFALNSLVFSFLCKHSTSFVTLEKPMLLSATFEPITEVGLFYLKLCLAKTIVNKDHQLGVETIVQNSWIIPGGSETFNLGDFSREYTIYSGNTSSSSSLDQKMMFYDDPICTTASMNSEMVDDLMWKLARTFVGWTTVYGIFMTAVVFCIAFWSSVSLNNISVCLLMLYFFQCLVFFFFDCKLCQKHICALSSGAIHALVATLSWFVSGMSCIRLLFLERERIRADRRKRRREMRRQQRASSHLSLSPTKSVRSTYSELRSVPSPIKLSTTSENGQSMNLISPSKSITSSLHNII